MSDVKGPSFRHLAGYLDEAKQVQLVEVIKEILVAAPPFQPTMPKTGKPFSVRMSNCGVLGWVSDKAGGYRYQPTHPLTGQPWPPMPESLLQIWRDLAQFIAPPEACLINLYRGTAKMGAHQDRDEADFNAPVLSVSLGDEAVFHVGGHKRTDAKTRVRLKSGDVVLLENESRLAFHGIDRVIAGSSDLLARTRFWDVAGDGGNGGTPSNLFADAAGGGRINLTLRRVTRFA